MAQQNNPHGGDENLSRLDSFIDNNFAGIEENDYETRTNFNEEEIQTDPSSISETVLYRRSVSLHRRSATLNVRHIEQDFDEHIKAIVQHMDREYKNMELKSDSQEAELSQKETLRSMPQSLAVKKRVSKQTTSNRGSKKTVGMFKMMKYQLAISWSHLKGKIKDLSYTFELWYGSLKKIEGNFGSGVASYFKFLRWLFIVNLAMTIITLCFVIIPQIILGVPENHESFSVMNLLNGSGYLDSSLLYYGSYSNATVGGYNITSAYFFTMPIVYLAVFILISISMASSYKKSFIMTEGGVQNVFANKIFCGWDYSIQTRKAADLKMKSIYNELTELVNDENRTNADLSFCDKFRIYTMQGIGHVFAVTISLAGGYLMYTLLKENNDFDHIVRAICINAVMVVVPMIFRVITKYEEHKNPRTRLFIMLARTIFLELCVIAVFIYYVLPNTNPEETCRNETNTNEIKTNETTTEENCWENNFAQEVYRLIIFDFFFSTLFMTLIDLAWFLIHKLTDLIEAPEFDIATNTLSIIYNQTLFWVGFYFSPLLGAMVVLKLFLTWYVRSIVLLNCCQAPKKSWRAAQTETWFLIIAFLWSLLLLFVHGFHIFSDTIKSSTECGPLRDGHFTNITWENTFGTIILFFIKPGVVTCILIALAFGVYYLRAVAKAQIEMVDFLRDRLQLVGMDKNFLLQRITEASQDFNYKKTDEGFIDPTKLAPPIYKAMS